MLMHFSGLQLQGGLQLLYRKATDVLTFPDGCWQPLTEHSKTFLFLRDLPGDFGWGSSQRTPWQANWAFLRTALLCKALLLTLPFTFLSFTQAQACILVWWLSKSLSSHFLSQPFRLINLLIVLSHLSVCFEDDPD